MCPKRPDLSILKKNVVVEGSQYNSQEQDRSFNILNFHSHKHSAITAGYMIGAAILVFCLFLAYKKWQARAVVHAERRSNEQTANSVATIEQLVEEIRGRRRSREHREQTEEA